MIRKLGLARSGAGRAAALQGVPDFPDFTRDMEIEAAIEGFVLEYYRLLHKDPDPFTVIAGTSPWTSTPVQTLWPSTPTG